jgi:catechol 2,3-dioxygenase-like lactoylglutathione lyase family enzyme
MKRFHVHLAVADLEASVAFYRALFASEPTVLKPDYAKWMLDDPRVNFAISTRGRLPGLDHLGIQAESDEELGELRDRLDTAALPAVTQEQAACCYARSNKHWTVDPQGLAWESFHSLDTIPMFGADDVPSEGEAKASACCAPAVESVKVAFPAPRRGA